MGVLLRGAGSTATTRLRRLALLISIVIAGCGLPTLNAHAAPPAYAATASLAPAVHYLGDSAGSIYKFTVHNTGATATIGGVEIKRPKGWGVTSCPAPPAGWTATATSRTCRFRSAPGAAGDIKPGQSRILKVKATTRPGSADRVGTWSIKVSRTNQFDSDSQLKAAAPTKPDALQQTLSSFQVSSAVVSGETVVPGDACPPPNKVASPGSSRTIIVCGRNRANVALTPVAAQSSLSGSYIGTVGTFSSGSITPGSEVVLGQWDDTEIAGATGTRYRITTAIGAARDVTSTLRTFKGYSVDPAVLPVAQNDSFVAAEDSPLARAAATGLLANDTDADPDPIQVTGHTEPAHGAVTVADDGAFTYTPDADYNGSDTFDYTVGDADGDSTSPGTVAISVGAVNDAPSFVRGPDQEVAAGSGAISVDPWATEIDSGPADESGQSPVFSVTAVDPSLFTVQPAISATGALTYTVGSATGSTDVRVTLHDNGGTANGGDDTSAQQSFTIAVVPGNAAPTASATNATGNEDGGAITVALTGHDADGDAVTFDVNTASSGSVGSPGPVTCNGLTPSTCTATVTYNPNPNFYGADSFTYTSNDGTVDSATAAAIITVSGVNDAPSFAKGDDQTVLEDAGEQTVEGWASAISAGPGDESLQNIDFVVTSDNDTLFASPPSITDGGDLSFTPATDAHGVATLSVKVVDDGGTANGGVDESATKTFTINVASVNDAPSFTKGEDQVVVEDAGAQSVSGWATAISKGPGNESGQSVSFNVTNDNNALFSSQPAVSDTGTLTFTGAASAAGSATVSVSITDTGGTAGGGDDTSNVQTFTITISGVNTAPSFTHDGAQTVPEDSGAQSVVGFVNSTDPGAPDEAGQTVTVSVTGTDNDSLFSSLPTIDAAGTLTYTAAPNATGTATVTAHATDDGGTTNGGDDTGPDQTFTITVTAVNDEPSFTKGSDQTLNEDSGAQSVSGWAAAISKGPANESGQSLSFSVSNSNNALFSAQPTVSPTGTLTFTSAPNRYGTATVSVSLSDNGGTANGGDDTSPVQTFTITVDPVNDAPVAAAKSYTVQAGMKISLGGLLTGATDPNDVAGDPSWTPSFTLGSISVGAGCIGCTVSNVDNAAGTFDFDPPAGGTGTYTLSYTVRDNGSPGTGVASANQTITVTVNGPVIWFVDPGAGPGGTGRLSAPFNNLAAATTAMGSNTNQRIFVSGGNVTGNVTLQTDGWLISDAVTGASFDSVMGVTPPAGTIARPTVNSGSQRTLTGTVTLGTNSVVRGFDLTPASGSRGLVASGKSGITVNQVSITSTAARAVDLLNSSGVFDLKRVTSTGSDRGISLVSANTSTGSFTVNGAGSAGTGGVISDSTALGTPQAKEGGIYLNNTKNVTLKWMTISSNDANGIYGTNVTNLLVEDSTLPDNGTSESLLHSGIYVDNLLGPSALNRIDVSGSRYNGARILNTSGSATIAVAHSTFRDNHATVGVDGLSVLSLNSAAVTVTSTSNTFSNNHQRGLQIASYGTQTMNATVTGGSYTGNRIFGLELAANGPAGIAFNVTGGTATACAGCGQPVRVTKSQGGTAAGTITGMTVDSANGTDPGIFVYGVGPGALRVAITNNTISQAAAYWGVAVETGNTVGGAMTADVAITNNTINQATTGSQASIYLDAGMNPGDVIDMCAHIAGNNISNPVSNDIQLINSFSTTSFRLPGYTGAAMDATAVRNFLLAQNTAADASPLDNSGTSGFGGGGACAAP